MQFVDKRKHGYLEELFESWKHIVAFKGGSSIHNKALKQKVLTTLIKRKKQRKIEHFTNNKSKSYFQQKLKQKAFDFFQQGVEISRVKRTAKQETVSLARVHYRKYSKSRCLKAWMTVVYRQRVYKYLQRKMLHKVGSSILE